MRWSGEKRFEYFDSRINTVQIRRLGSNLAYLELLRNQATRRRPIGYRLRDINAEGKFCANLKLEVLESVLPQALIEAVLQECGLRTARERKLNLVVTVMLMIAMNVYTHTSLGHVLQKVSQGLRYIWPEPAAVIAGKSAISYRRAQLGVRPLARLLRRLAQPIATPQTRGAFRFGLRLMALDGSIEEVPDTEENRAVFGGHHGGRGTSNFPQVRVSYLIECGTHKIVDACFWPYRVAEQTGAWRLLRSVGAGMLLMWDRGYFAYDLLCAVIAREAHLLIRLKANLIFKPERRLCDGSFLAYSYPSNYQRRQAGERQLVRIIQYRVTDPALPGYGQLHRLLTTLLDPQRYPALELIELYHERWEIELVIDEIETHQRLAQRCLRSLSPRGVIQELYGLVLAHVAVRSLMHAAAVEADLDPDRLSFVHALEVIRAAVPEFQQTTPAELPRLAARMLRDMTRELLPPRRWRSNPRVVKTKMSKFKQKRPEHRSPPQPSRPFRESIAVVI